MKHVDLLMIGGGPSNLALAVALEEHDMSHKIKSSLILEKDSSVCWHRGMLFPEAQTQVSFLKDLVTQRDPTSKYSFLNFLHKTNRLDNFINLQTFNPYRQEISDYLQWVANNLNKTSICYNSNVSSISPEVSENGKICGWYITTDNDDKYYASKLVFGAGRDLNIPSIFDKLSKDKVIHSANYLTSLEKINKNAVSRIAVIGGAQSSAEIYQSCIDLFPDAKIDMIMRSIGLVNYEGSQFTNTLFQNDYIDVNFNCDDITRAKTLSAMHTTNYSGVAPSTLSSLYRFHYLQDMRGEHRVSMHTQCQIMHAVESDYGVIITWQDNKTGSINSETYDYVFLGTGYKNKTPHIFNKLSHLLDIEHINVNRQYRAILPYADGASLHLQGVNESTHGISDSLLSVIAHRSKEILDDIKSI
ncbi:L-ornithine N5-oxygenase [Aeromonas hydrophila]|uniref:lysine N(6)-hydroxylase/L-ornithine N(5)-oxygenase family protein n=1 Tax=Aeromonas hydrophila TaxID=644 RepID=UPI002168B7E5|nr:lysine N(6)-hydroxylase/L-ornithine N(5)-oxygenase family protein [Aeromonas hydrophila]MCS3769218.1 L-ornithine N5-oxygenase [Aeromonas hydrophila]